MTLPLSLPTSALEHPAMDYDFLRHEGIRILERLGGQLWTDFNAHDPGITILEQVCYAITDLAYRTNYDIKDILASADENPYRSLHSPAQVLTTYPVTISDLRKLLIDVPGVKNAWFEPVEKAEPGLLYDPSENSIYLKTPTSQPPHREPVPLRGLYQVLIEADSSLAFHAADILPEVNRRLHACRGLGEDFVTPIILPGQGIVVNAMIEISAVDDPEQLLAKLYYAVANSISPRVRFHTLTEMLDKGKRIDEIMDGPALQHGFIDDAELESPGRKIGLRTSDLIQEIINVEGARTVSRINISDDIHSEDWYLKLDPLRTPFLDVGKSLFNANGSSIRLMRGGIEVQVKPARVGEILKRLQQADIQQPLPVSQRDIRLPAGQERKIGQYYSIQHQFPATYGIGAIGLPDSASPQRKAQAKQLKAYLMFFDQLLANYFAQLGNAKELFSFYAQQPRTYFSQVIEDTSLDLDEIRDNGDLAAHAAKVQDITEASALGPEIIAPDDPAFSERKNRFLNHLLARFAEQFTDYSLLLYAHISEQDLIEDKIAFLRDYHQIGAARGSGFNYTLPSWEKENISGLEKRVSRKLGISSYRKHDLAGMDNAQDGGFHMLEHLLLRPSPADKEQWAQAEAGTGWQAAALVAEPVSNDPYSHQISFIFPKWVTRFSEKGFSDLIEKTLREETPAHIRIYLHWLDREQMLTFESAYKTWLNNVIAGRLWNPIDIQPGDDLNHMIHIKLRDARDRMVQVLGIGTPYPLRDLKLVYPPMVAYNRPTTIQILGGQVGVLYQLCDEDGNPFIEKGNRFEIRPEAGVAEDGVLLPTPAIIKDITFTVLAIREDKDKNLQAETYLNQLVSVKVGIDTSLPVVFSPSTGQVANANQIITNYGDKVSVTVSNTQEGISYKLVMGPADALVNLSGAQKGNQSAITLVSSQGFNEDTQINVLAYRTASTKVFAILDTVLTIQVRPNPAVQINIVPPIIDYNTSSTLTLNTPQSSAEYRLFKRELTPAEYLSSEAGGIVIETDEGRRVFVRSPEQITDWDAPAGFVSVKLFKDSKGNLSATTGSLSEDTLFIVQATKVVNRERLQLLQAVAILVRPDPAPIVAVKNEVVETGQNGMVTLKKTQKGVAYLLRLDADNTPINPPGYHLTDRGVETVRVEVDLLIEDQGKAILLLPTNAITQATSFNILASKLVTGVSAQLTGKATLDIIKP
ncbi:MAG TPA: hypothetical protein DCG54_08450 [Anaerolineae bacterium]|jgi:hypothetical protein|nr:hypothetical protein [Anaerolineae bacterium]